MLMRNIYMHGHMCIYLFIISSDNRKMAMVNAKDVLGVSDVVDDAVHSFKKKYRRHTRLEDGDELSLDCDSSQETV